MCYVHRGSVQKAMVPGSMYGGNAPETVILSHGCAQDELGSSASSQQISAELACVQDADR